MVSLQRLASIIACTFWLLPLGTGCRSLARAQQYFSETQSSDAFRDVCYAVIVVSCSGLGCLASIVSGFRARPNFNCATVSLSALLVPAVWIMLFQPGWPFDRILKLDPFAFPAWTLAAFLLAFFSDQPRLIRIAMSGAGSIAAVHLLATLLLSRGDPVAYAQILVVPTFAFVAIWSGFCVMVVAIVRSVIVFRRPPSVRSP